MICRPEHGAEGLQGRPRPSLACCSSSACPIVKTEFAVVKARRRKIFAMMSAMARHAPKPHPMREYGTQKKARNRGKAVSLSWTIPSSLSNSFEHIESTYDCATINAALSWIFLATHTSGHPPLQQRKARRSISIGLLPCTIPSPENKADKLTEPSESPDSNNENGRIIRREILPVPLCLFFALSSFFKGAAEPVRM